MIIYMDQVVLELEYNMTLYIYIILLALNIIICIPHAALLIDVYNIVINHNKNTLVFIITNSGITHRLKCIASYSIIIIFA